LKRTAENEGGRARPYYTDGLRTLYHGDCLEAREWLAADVAVTDPPFGMSYCSGWQERPIANDGDTVTRDAALALWGDRPALVFGRWNCPHPLRSRMTLTWDKGDWPGMGDLKLPWGPSTEEIYVIGDGFVGKRKGSVIRVDRLVGELLHPNEKPVALLARLIESCPPPWVIADPFAGSGTTLLAAKLMGRKAIGVELEERYCEVIANRLAQGVLFAPEMEKSA
jgi:DNA modification methylase